MRRNPGRRSRPWLRLLLVSLVLSVVVQPHPSASGAVSPGVPSGSGALPTEHGTGVASGLAFLVNLTERGLPAGGLWNLTIAGTTWNVTGPSLVVYEPNGSYNYSALALGFPPVRASFAVTGGPLSVAIDFSVVPPAAVPGAPSSSEGPTPSFAFGIIAGLLLLVFVALLTVARRKRHVPLPAVPIDLENLEPVSPPPGRGPRDEEPDPDPVRHML